VLLNRKFGYGGGFTLLGALLALGTGATAGNSAVEGTWRTHNGTEITIASCAQGLCGTLNWVVVPKADSAQCLSNKAAYQAQMLDIHNRDQSLRNRPILGMQTLTLTATPDPAGFKAQIYNAQDGKTYDGQVWVVDANKTLRLGAACIGSLCAVTQDWPRFPTRTGAPDFTCGTP
jgi:uncharacterized protein (DUF2147 family)